MYTPDPYYYKTSISKLWRFWIEGKIKSADVTCYYSILNLTNGHALSHIVVVMDTDVVT